LEQHHRARNLQSMLLPKRGFAVAEWETYYDYEPAGAVGGDYCDLIAVDGKLYFFLGDAVGKGLAASMIASQLHSLFRALLPQELPINQLFERINRIFCECQIADYYATLVFAIVVWKFVGALNHWAVLLAATLSWAVASVLIWKMRKLA